MNDPQLYPLEVNPTTGEPFLRLLRHKNIIITPPRLSDAPCLVRILNDERVYPWLSSPPHPYLPEHAEWWLNHVTAISDKLLTELESARDDPERKIVDGSPVQTIREIKEDGMDIFLGCIDLTLAQQWWALEGSGRTNQEAPRRDPRDPDIWTVGDYLTPSHHGQGIMSDAFKTLLSQWGVPRMGIRLMVVTVLKGNKGSVKVLEKNGFEFRKTIDDALDVRGTMRGVHVLEWRLEETTAADAASL
ncbi:acyl-CoA N-acyltransferase [Mycena pura]|uniref:Acyl-CoA N-acyltransferase n=1 Tax=Mycena pura TaxID=153505 RepID=A0AAD6YBW7_9AGAR|nr:acyl-CoA N-acyltransferase [Mycena pura]